MIKIIIDSASDIDAEEAIIKGVTLIPVEVRFGDETFLDGVNLTHQRFFEKLIESDELPKTSQINQFRWEQAFDELTRDGSDVIAITLSSKLSGTHDCAKNAAKKYGGKVRVVDSLNAAVGERILCDYAIRLVAEGKTADETCAFLNENKKNIRLLAVVDTLKYLRKGGRISGVAAFAGEMLSIKPVVAVINGEVKLVGKAVGSKRSNNLLMKLVGDCGGIDFSMPYGLAYSGLNDGYLQKYLRDSRELWEKHVENAHDIPAYMIGSTIGTHVGANAIAVAFFALGKRSANVPFDHVS